MRMTALKDLELERVRRNFAEEIRAVCNLQTEALVEALAAVPRKRFLNPGPWQIRGMDAEMGAPPRTTPDDDSRRGCHNVSIALDAQRHLYNCRDARARTADASPANIDFNKLHMAQDGISKRL